MTKWNYRFSLPPTLSAFFCFLLVPLENNVLCTFFILIFDVLYSRYADKFTPLETIFFKKPNKNIFFSSNLNFFFHFPKPQKLNYVFSWKRAFLCYLNLLRGGVAAAWAFGLASGLILGLRTRPANPQQIPWVGKRHRPEGKAPGKYKKIQLPFWYNSSNPGFHRISDQNSSYPQQNGISFFWIFFWNFSIKTKLITIKFSRSCRYFVLLYWILDIVCCYLKFYIRFTFFISRLHHPTSQRHSGPVWPCEIFFCQKRVKTHFSSIGKNSPSFFSRPLFYYSLMTFVDFHHSIVAHNFAAMHDTKTSFTGE